MVWIDYLLIAIVVVSAVVSLFRGFFREALSLATWIAALLISWQFGGLLADGLQGWIGDPVVRLWAGRLLTFILVLVLGGLVGRLAGILMDSSGLTGTDRLLGMIFGMARGIVLAAILVVGLDVMGFDQSPWWNESKLIPYAAPIADIIRGMAEDGLELLDDTELLP